MNRKGFTLVELLGTIVIIGLVIAGSAFGIIKLIDESKSKGKNISVAGIEKSAGTYAEEKNDDENYWQTMTRDDIEGLAGEYFCVTIGELQNKGLVDKNLDFKEISDVKNNIKIEKSTYVGIRKDMVTHVKSNPTLLDDSKYRDLSNGNYKEENIIYGVCTGNIVNEKITLIKAKNGTSFTDEITNINFDDVTSALDGVDITIKEKKCTYSEGDSYSENNHQEGYVDWNTNNCSITGLDSKKNYSIRVCERTEGGSQSCDTVVQSTLEVKKPTFTLSDKVNIIYDTTGIKSGKASYYFKSNIDATSSVNSNKCTLTTDTKDKKVFSCDNSSTTSITKDTWYKSSNKNISLSYSTNGTGRVDAITTDKSGNFAESYKEFVIYKTLFKKGEATTIGGGTTDISKFCLAPINGSCKVTSPSIEKVGYDAKGWNTNGSATTASWKAGTEQAVSSDGTYYPILSISVYNINYNANGGSGAPSGQTKKYGDSITLSTTKPTRSNYDFIGWNTASNGTGTSYASGATYSANANVTLYAQWKTNTCTITYDANGGYGAPSTQTVNCGSNATISSTRPSRSGYSFSGWNSGRYGSGTNYTRGRSYTINSDLDLYAQWEKNSTSPTLSYSPSDGSSVCSGTKVTLTCRDNSGTGMKEAKIEDNGTIRTGTSSASDNLNTLRNGNITTSFSCTDNEGNKSTGSARYTVKNCSSGSSDGDSGNTSTSKSCPSGYTSISTTQCRKFAGSATCAATCRTFSTKASCNNYSSYCIWTSGSKGDCRPKTQYENKCLKYKCSKGTLSGTSCYYYANKS